MFYPATTTPFIRAGYHFCQLSDCLMRRDHLLSKFGLISFRKQLKYLQDEKSTPAPHSIKNS